MQCPRCRAENRETRRFCGECGSSLSATCPACGFSNEGTEKFYGGCGKSLVPLPTLAEPKFSSPQSHTPRHLAERILTSKAALEGEGKQVTVLFADLKGSMELLADRDPEEARRLLDPVIEHMMEAVHRYEGTVNQVMGDGIMATFRGEEWDKAVRYGRHAAAKTVGRSANQEAKTYLEQALDALGRLPDSRQTREMAVDLRLDLYVTLLPLDQLRPLLQRLREAEALAQALEDRERLGWARLHLCHVGGLLAENLRPLMELAFDVIGIAQDLGHQQMEADAYPWAGCWGPRCHG